MRLDKDVRSGLSAERPFPGLRPFGYGDREFFFGRDDQIFALYRLLDLSRFIAVIGSSGSGKSSLVRAGLLPLLDQEAAQSGGRDWLSITLHPGDAPLSELASALAGLIPSEDGGEAPDLDVRRDRIAHALTRSSFGLSDALDEIPEAKGKTLLIVVDQFEELFRYASSASDRIGDSLWRDESANFVQLLLEISRDRSRQVQVLITMRSDFIGDCAQFHGLPEAVSAAQFLAPSLTRDQREDVIRRPVEKAGATIESGLVERLLNDVSSDDQLPVLQHCLLRLWDQAGRDAAPGQPRKLTLEDYNKVGRISGALSQHADEVMASLPGLELAVEQIFRALSEVDKEGRATRRALFFNQLLAETGLPEEQLRKVLDRFRAGDCSFILPSPETDPRLREDTRIDVVHEALLRRWDRISAPTHELRDGQVEAGWLSAEERDGRFYRALLALVEAAPAAGAVTLPLDQVEPRWKWWKSRPRTAAWAQRYAKNLPDGGLSRVDKLFADSRAALEADRKRREEEQQRERDEERRKIEAAEAAKRAELEHQAEMAALQAAAAKRLTARTRVAAIAMSIIAIIALGVGAFAAIAWKKALADETQTQLALRQAKIANQTAERERQSALADAAIAQRERRNALIALKQADAARRQAVDAQQRTLVALNQAEAATQRANAATTRANVATKVAIQRRAAVFLQSGRQAFLGGDNDDASVLLAAAYHDDSSDPSVRLVLGQALKKLAIRAGSFRAHDELITSLQFDPDPKHRWIATASADETAKLWDSSGHLVHVFNDQGGVITALAFDPSGRYLVSVGRDGSALLRDLSGITLTSARAPVELKGEVQRINSVVFNHAGTMVAAAGNDGKVDVWKISGGSPFLVLDAGATTVDAAAFTGGDKSVAAASSDGELRVWNTATGKLSGSYQIASKSPLLRLAAAPSGQRVAAGAADGTVLIFDAGTQKHIERRDQRGAVNALAFDPSGSFLVSADEDGTSRIFDAASGETRAVLPGTTGVLSVAFSPSGTIATTYEDGSVSLWSLSGEALARLHAHSSEATAAEFDASGGLLATAGDDGNVFLWHPPSSLVPSDFAQSAAVDAIAFNAGGNRVVTAARDGTAVVWRLGSGLTRDKVLAHGAKTIWVTSAEFSPDGKRIVTAGGQAVKIWPADGSSVKPIATIVPGAASKRFTQAAFVGNGGDVIAATASDLPGGGDGADRWTVWSGDGKRKLLDEPNYQQQIDGLFVSRNGYFVLAKSATGAATFSYISGKTALDSWQSVSAAALSNSHFSYALGHVNGSVEQRSFDGHLIAQFAGHRGRVSALAFSPDDSWLASAGTGDLLGKIWDVRSGRLHATLTGDEGEIDSIAFSPDKAPFVLTTSSDGTARVWNRDNGDLLASVSVPGSILRTAAFTRDGSGVVLGAQNGGLYLWRLHVPLGDPKHDAAEVLAALQHVNVANLRANPLVAQAVDELAASAGEETEMARMAGEDRTTEGFQAAMSNEPTKAAGDVLPAFLAAPQDPALDLTTAELYARFGSLRATFQSDGQRINRVLFAERGTKVVTTSFDMTAKVWDVASGRLLHVLAGFDTPAAFLATQRSGSLAVVAGLGDHVARVWNLDTGRERPVLEMGSPVVKVAFSADGSRVAVEGADKTVRVWDAASGKRLGELRTDEAIVSWRISADGNSVLIASAGDAAIWNVASGRKIKLAILEARDSTAISRVDLHERLPLAATLQGNVIREWDTHSGQLVRTLRSKTKLSWVAFGRENDAVAGAGEGGISVWRLGRATEFLRPSGTVTERIALFADHDRRIVGVGTKRSVAMWDAQDGDLIGEFAGTDSDYVDADVSSDAASIVTAGEDGVTHLWNADVAAPSGSRFDQGSPVVDLQVDRAGTRLLVRGASGAVRVWNLATRKVAWERTFGRGDAARIRLTPDGRAVVVLAQASLTVLDAATGRAMRSQTMSGTWSLSPSGRYVVSIQSKHVAVFDAIDAAQRSFDAGAAQRAHFGSTDDVVVLEGAVQSKIASPSGTPLATLGGAGTNVGAALSTDGRRLLTFGSRMSPTLWNIAPGRTTAVAILYGYGGDVKGAAFSGDGQRVVTIGSDGTARVWSATSGQPLGSFGGEAQRLNAARFSPDGKFIVTISEAGALGVWDDRGTGLLSFPTSSAQAVAPCAVGNLELFAVDGEGVMRYQIDRPPSAPDVRALEQRLGMVRSVAAVR